MMPYLLFGTMFGSALTIFALENAAPAALNLYTYQLVAPLSYEITTFGALTAICAILALTPRLFRMEKRIAKLTLEKSALENELSKYRITIPIAPPEQYANSFSAESVRVAAR